MRCKLRYLLVVLGGWVGATILAAEAAAQQETPPETVIRAFADPTLTSPLRAPLSQVVLSGTTEKSVAKAEIGLQGLWAGFRVFAQTPLSEEQEEAVLVDFDGLRASTTVGVGITWLNWKPGFVDQDAAEALCKIQNTDPCAKDNLRPDLQDDWDLTVNYGLRVTGAVEVRAGREVFEFLEASNFEDEEVEHTPASLAASIGVYVPSGIMTGLWSASLEGQRSYKAGDKAEICRPVGTGSLTRCEEAVVGEPTERERLVLTGGHRRRLGAGVAIDPRIHYDLNNSEVGIELPIYALRNAEGGLTGGLSLGWTSGSDQVAVEVFVGNVFGIFGN